MKYTARWCGSKWHTKTIHRSQQREPFTPFASHGHVPATKKLKHLLQWCWASPRWSQHGTLLMSRDTSHLEAQRFKTSALQDAIWQRHSSIKTLCQCLSASPAFHLLNYFIKLPSPSLPPVSFHLRSLGNAGSLIFQQFLITLVNVEDISDLFSHYRDPVSLLY